MVELDESGLREIQDGRVVVSIDARDVEAAVLVRGRRSERPVPQLVLGAAVVAVGLFFLRVLWNGWLSKLAGLGVLALPFGLYMIWSALRWGPVVLVKTPGGERRLFPADEQLEALGRQLASRYPP